MSVVLPAPVGPTTATRSPRLALERDVLDRALPALVGEGHVVELDGPASIARCRSRPSFSTTSGFSARIVNDAFRNTKLWCRCPIVG